MKQLERRKVITYRWWRGEEKDIKPAHISVLDEEAEEHIAAMMVQGYVSGELHDNIYAGPDDPADGIEYTGWWEVKTE